MHDVDSMHVDEGALLALIDGETLPGEGSQSHVRSCDACTQKLEELRFADRRAKAALEGLDAASPLATMPEALRDAARKAGSSTGSATPAETVIPIGSVRRGTRRPGRSVAAAAGFVFVFAAGAYAIPGSPVRSFVDRAIFGDVQGPADPGPGQVAVDPVNGSIRVVIQGATPGLRITIRSVSASRASVSARDARFAVESGEIRISDATGDLAIDLPASSSATVEIDGATVARSVSGNLSRLPEADGSPAAIIVETAG